MYAEERLKSELRQEALEKRGSAPHRHEMAKQAVK